jgi:hypothetical protein
MNWSTIQTTLDTWFKRATGLDLVVWDRQAAPMMPRPYGEMNITSTSNVGTDEVRRTYDSQQPPGQEIISEVCGQRIFVLNCRVRSRDNRPGYQASAYIEKLRNSLAKPNTIALFQSAEISLAEATPTVDLTGLFQDRQESYSSFDLRMNAVISEIDPLDQVGYIDKIEITSDLKDVSGNSLPNSLQLIEEEIP